MSVIWAWPTLLPPALHQRAPAALPNSCAAHCPPARLPSEVAGPRRHHCAPRGGWLRASCGQSSLTRCVASQQQRRQHGHVDVAERRARPRDAPCSERPTTHQWTEMRAVSSGTMPGSSVSPAGSRGVGSGTNLREGRAAIMAARRPLPWWETRNCSSTHLSFWRACAGGCCGGGTAALGAAGLPRVAAPAPPSGWTPGLVPDGPLVLAGRGCDCCWPLRVQSDQGPRSIGTRVRAEASSRARARLAHHSMLIDSCCARPTSAAIAAAAPRAAGALACHRRSAARSQRAEVRLTPTWLRRRSARTCSRSDECGRKR